MAATPRQIAANRQNALKSTGPRTEEGKEASRQNALKHGLTGGGVVIPGEDEHEVTIRVARLEAELGVGGDAVGTILVRQLAIASIRTERAYRHESALAAERMRRAADTYEERRRAEAQEIFDAIASDPATARRRLLGTPEGIDLLVGRLRALGEKTEPQTHIVWDTEEGAELDRCLGWRPEAELKSRVGILTRAIAFDRWIGFDPAEIAGKDDEAKLLWAVGEVGAIIAGEVERLEAHRPTLDRARAEQGSAEAAERELLDLGKDGTALRRYAGAAERAVFKALREIRIRRSEIAAEAQAQVVEPGPVAEILAAGAATATQTREASQFEVESASFCPARGPVPRHQSSEMGGSVLDDLKSTYVPIAAGRPPGQRGAPGA